MVSDLNALEDDHPLTKDQQFIRKGASVDIFRIDAAKEQDSHQKS